MTIHTSRGSRRGMRRFPIGWWALVMACAAGAAAQPISYDPNAAPLVVSVRGGGLVTLAGDAPTSMLPGVVVEADGPIAYWKNRSAGRILARLALTSSPGQPIDLTDPTTFQAAAAQLALARVMATIRSGDQEISTSLVGHWGFASRMDTDDRVPAVRLVRRYGGGVRLTARSALGAGAPSWLQVSFGRDQAAGAIGWGQWMIESALPVVGTRGALVFEASAVVSAGPYRSAPQRDFYRFAAVVDMGAAIRALR